MRDKGAEMKNLLFLIRFALLGFITWLFIACSTVKQSVTLNYDTEPRGALIMCNGKIEAHSPFTMSFSGERSHFKNSIDDKGDVAIPPCKAIWASGYEDYFPIKVKVPIPLRDNIVLTAKLKRNKDKNYNNDLIAEQRWNKIKEYLNQPGATSFNFKAVPKGANILCEKTPSVLEQLQKALKTGIFEIAKCKAVWISGYEQAFKHKINLDSENLSTLFSQTLNRPNTKGYADDMRWALELEKKEILEMNERARTQAIQAQAAAQERAARAAEAQAQTMQMEATRRNLEAARRNLENSELNKALQNFENRQRTQDLHDISNSVRSIDRTLKGQPHFGLGGLVQ